MQICFFEPIERVLLKAGEFKACTYDELFEKTNSPWEEYIPENGKFWVKKLLRSKANFSVDPSDIQSIMKSHGRTR